MATDCWRGRVFLRSCECASCKVKDARLRWLAGKVSDMVELLQGRAYLRLPPPGDDPWDEREPVGGVLLLALAAWLACGTAYAAVAPPMTQSPEPPYVRMPSGPAFVPPAALASFAGHLARVEEYAALAEAHYDWAANQVVMCPHYQNYADAALEHARAWRLLSIALSGERTSVLKRAHFYQWPNAEEAALWLEEMLGPDDWAAGWMPPPMPCWADWPD